MFERPTVIILGAGASEPFGFPLGRDLYQDILDGVGNVRARLDNREFSQLKGIGHQNSDYFAKEPFEALASYLGSNLAKPFLPEDVLSYGPVNRLFLFEEILGGNTNTRDTIDKFIWDNPSHAFIGKVLIAARVMLKMYKQDDGLMRLRSFSERYYDQRRNWYHRLIDILRDGADGPEALQQNNLSIVTFNYDRSLDIALSGGLGSSERHSGAKLKDALQIFHVNGTAPELPPTITDAGKFILECANELHLVDEQVGTDLNRVRDQARSAIYNAKRIYVMGFAFDTSNTSTIGLDKLPNSHKVFCLNFDGNLGVSRRIMELGIPESAITVNAGGNEIQIVDALDNDFLGR